MCLLIIPDFILLLFPLIKVDLTAWLTLFLYVYRHLYFLKFLSIWPPLYNAGKFMVFFFDLAHLRSIFHLRYLLKVMLSGRIFDWDVVVKDARSWGHVPRRFFVRNDFVLFETDEAVNRVYLESLLVWKVRAVGLLVEGNVITRWDVAGRRLA